MTATAGIIDLLTGLPGVHVTAGSPADAVDGISPVAVARPEDEAAVAAVLRLATERGLAVIPRGGGTALALGAVPRRFDLLLDLGGLNHIVEYHPRDLTATAEAGVSIKALNEALAAHGQMVPLDPPMPAHATVGGTLATNLSGPRRLRHGTARDCVIGSGAVLADGTAIKSGGRVVKNVAGYDLNKLLIGSAGTLAVITRATFKLSPLPAKRGMAVALFDSAAAAHAVAMRIADGTLAPLTLDIAGPGALPGAVPDAAGWTLLVEIAGAPVTVVRARDTVIALAHRGGARSARSLDERDAAPLVAALRDFGHNDRTRAPLLLRASVLPSRTGAALDICSSSPDGYAPPHIVAHAGNGVVLSAWDVDGVAEVRRIIEEVRTALAPLDGIVTVEQCPAAAKDGLDVWGISGPDVELMHRVRREFNPDEVLSPGRGV
jgi:glycolate oxidase FAD binding subunit